MIDLRVPNNLFLGGRPFNQITALYHLALTGGELSIQSYSSEWGWSEYETKSFMLRMQQDGMLQSQQNSQNNNWHDPCNISTNSTISNITNTNTITNNNNTISTISTETDVVVVEENQIKFLFGEKSIEIDPTADPKLLNFFFGSEDCVDLLTYWLLKCTEIGHPVPKIEARDLGAIAGAVKAQGLGKAIDVFDWAFDSTHYRAEWLRKKGILAPASLISKKKLESNHTLALTAKQTQEQPKKQPIASKAINTPKFDENGNLIA